MLMMTMLIQMTKMNDGEKADNDCCNDDDDDDEGIDGDDGGGTDGDDGGGIDDDDGDDAKVATKVFPAD